MDPQILSLINFFYVFAFVLLLFLAVGRIARRIVEYKRQGESVPLILKRDALFLTGLSTPFLGVLIFRAFGINASEQFWYPLWVIASGTFAIIGTAVWVYIEYFKIEKK